MQTEQPKRYIDYNSHNKETVVLIHGYASFADMFEPFAKIFPEFRFISVYLPTHFEPDKQFSLDELARYIDDVVKELKLETFGLCGFSLGGIIAINYATKYPSKVEKLYVLNSYPSLVPYKIARILMNYLEPILTTRVFLRLYDSLNNSHLLRRILGVKFLISKEKSFVHKNYYSVIGTLMRCLPQDLTKSYLKLKMPKQVILFYDDNVVRPGSYTDHARKHSIAITMLPEGGHANKLVYWDTIAKHLDFS